MEENDRGVRDQSARLLRAICDKCCYAYPGLENVVFNQLTGTLFNPDTSLAAHYGAICGIRELGLGPAVWLLPHLPGYINCIRCELKLREFRQNFLTCQILSELEHLVEWIRRQASEMGDVCDVISRMLVETDLLG
jgi:hypothetical protein